MNDQLNVNDDSDQDDLQDEKESLRARLKQMGVTFSNNAGVEALRQKLADHLAGIKEDAPAEPEANTEPVDSVPQLEVGQTAKSVGSAFHQARQKARLDALKLVRVRISCMNPAKASWPGEIFTVSNEFIGTVRRFVPYGEQTDDGWHIEQCILDFMKEKKFQQVSSKRKKGQIDVTYDRFSPEFSFEVLPPLTPEQLRELGKAQLAAGTSGFHA
ncbi:hypothetical protein C121_79 [Stenotrophomonas phage C121]|uniref:hypothetical protein n=1 Tax=Stenotrophomonas phage C121 TaxID=2914029 RepID=UPI0023298483|nr:hypothetical protein PP752_gp79 [Stenotrophomonas phage C121]UKL14812.1 hypothetical protein C121_79 [Stenotrophomonas phage C121]